MEQYSNFAWLILIYLGLFALALTLFSKWLAPEVWLTPDGLYLQKYFTPKKVPLTTIAKIGMTARGQGDDYGTYLVRLKLTLTDGRKITVTHGQAPQWSFSWQNISSLFNKFEVILPKPEVLREVAQKHPNIKFDEYTKSYMETGEIKKFTEVID